MKRELLKAKAALDKVSEMKMARRMTRELQLKEPAYFNLEYEQEKQFRDSLKCDLNSIWKSRKEIRNQLHPHLDLKYLPKKRNNPYNVCLIGLNLENYRWSCTTGRKKCKRQTLTTS